MTSAFPPPRPLPPPPPRGWRGWTRKRKTLVVSGGVLAGLFALGTIVGPQEQGAEAPAPETSAETPATVRATEAMTTVTPTTVAPTTAAPATTQAPTTTESTTTTSTTTTTLPPPTLFPATTIAPDPDAAFVAYLRTPEALRLITVMPEYMGAASEALDTFNVVEGSVQASLAADTFRQLADGAAPYDGNMAGTFELTWRQCQFAWEAASVATVSFDSERVNAALPGLTQCSDGISSLTAMLDGSFG